MEVAPGIHRLGNELVNYYLVEADGGLTLIDAGLPAFYAQLEAFLRERGRAVADIDALLLTHPHGDHVGIAEQVRQAGVPVRIHELDAEQARTGKNHKRDGSMLPYFRHGATWRLLAMGVRAGGAKSVKIAEVTPFGEGELDVPGRPRVIHTPGHSPGHVVVPLRRGGHADRRRRPLYDEPADRPPGPADHAGRVLVLERAGDGLARADRGDRGGRAARGAWRSVDRGGRRRGGAGA